MGDLLDEVCKHFLQIPQKPDEDTLRVAIVGRPNVGKSSLVNKILGDERSIVTNIAGTTWTPLTASSPMRGKAWS